VPISAERRASSECADNAQQDAPTAPTFNFAADEPRNPDEYSHYVLLDHQDWLASHDLEGLREEWDLILKNSRPGTRILMRSASPEIDFIPEPVRDRLRFFSELTGCLHLQDRVGTYGSTLLAEVL
jgi:S-adenosylmethionine-diacylglycerol 3-amino-3-carboxypropyl transferase